MGPWAVPRAKPELSQSPAELSQSPARAQGSAHVRNTEPGHLKRDKGRILLLNLGLCVSDVSGPLGSDWALTGLWLGSVFLETMRPFLFFVSLSFVVPRDSCGE